MLPPVEDLVREVEASREALLGITGDLTPVQAAYRPSPGAWSVAETIEHLVWAEHSGLNKIVVATEAWRRGDPVWTGVHPDRDASIDRIVARTWRPKEKAPPIAEPTVGGPLPYWRSFFRSCRSVLADVAADVREDELDDVVFPHYLSGPLTVRQRLQFLRFHIVRHGAQIEELLATRGFPRHGRR